MIIMAPICFDPIAQAVGFQSGMTHWADYLKYAKFAADPKRPYGAT